MQGTRVGSEAGLLQAQAWMCLALARSGLDEAPVAAAMPSAF